MDDVKAQQLEALIQELQAPGGVEVDCDRLDLARYAVVSRQSSDMVGDLVQILMFDAQEDAQDQAFDDHVSSLTVLLLVDLETGERFKPLFELSVKWEKVEA